MSGVSFPSSKCGRLSPQTETMPPPHTDTVYFVENDSVTTTQRTKLAAALDKIARSQMPHVQAVIPKNMDYESTFNLQEGKKLTELLRCIRQVNTHKKGVHHDAIMTPMATLVHYLDTRKTELLNEILLNTDEFEQAQALYLQLQHFQLQLDHEITHAKCHIGLVDHLMRFLNGYQF